jgi:hypothetical protein
MPRKGLPRLGDSPRFYLDDTRRARVRSRGLEHYRPRRRRAASWLVAALVLIAAGLVWFYWITLG